VFEALCSTYKINFEENHLKIGIILILFISVSTFAIAEGKDQHFHHDTYAHALSSKILREAAKCEELALMLNYPDSTKYAAKALGELLASDSRNGKIYPSNKFLEIKLAYNAMRHFHYGRFSVLEEIDKVTAKSKFADIYKDSECNKLIE
jgi:hypothetical protein